jgi:N-ethylmaleimide reductase
LAESVAQKWLKPIATSNILVQNTNFYIFDDTLGGDATFVPVDKPKEMDRTDIENVINEFVQSSKNAVEAGFDGIEIHGANGYLIDQFLRSNSNRRTDEYGGTKENRIRKALSLLISIVQIYHHLIISLL